MKVLSERERGWVEGIVDGEGCLLLNGKGMAPQLHVSNADLNILHKLRDLVGTGIIFPANRSWVYLVTANGLRELLPQIQLICKERQRLLILEVLRMRELPQRERDFARVRQIQREIKMDNSNKGNPKFKIRRTKKH